MVQTVGYALLNFSKLDIVILLWFGNFLDFEDWWTRAYVALKKYTYKSCNLTLPSVPQRYFFVERCTGTSVQLTKHMVRIVEKTTCGNVVSSFYIIGLFSVRASAIFAWF